MFGSQVALSPSYLHSLQKRRKIRLELPSDVWTVGFRYSENKVTCETPKRKRLKAELKFLENRSSIATYRFKYELLRFAIKIQKKIERLLIFRYPPASKTLRNVWVKITNKNKAGESRCRGVFVLERATKFYVIQININTYYYVYQRLLLIISEVDKWMVNKMTYARNLRGSIAFSHARLVNAPWYRCLVETLTQ